MTERAEFVLFCVRGEGDFRLHVIAGGKSYSFDMTESTFWSAVARMSESAVSAAREKAGQSVNAGVVNL